MRSPSTRRRALSFSSELGLSPRKGPSSKRSMQPNCGIFFFVYLRKFLLFFQRFLNEDLRKFLDFIFGGKIKIFT